jgi:diguanylate cyclase (GGDEF)-like protein/PAS domain S-box-containing protein
MRETLIGDDIVHCHALMHAVSSLDGDAMLHAIDEILSNLFGIAACRLMRNKMHDDNMLAHALMHEDRCYGYLCHPVTATPNQDDPVRFNAVLALLAYLFYLEDSKLKRVRAMAELEMVLEEKRQILEQMSESVITVDTEGYITSWNRGAEKMFGYSAAEVIGRNIIFLYEDEDEEGVGILDLVDLGHQREMEVRRRKKTGEVFWASMSWSLLHGPKGESMGMIGYLNDITERKIAHERIQQLAFYDTLTGLPNRETMLRGCEKLIRVAQENSEHGCVLFVDLHRFKPISNTLGHEIGNAMLVEISLRLKRLLRDEDKLARVSEDAFAIAMFGVDINDHPGFMAQKIIAAFDEPFHIDDHELRIGAHVGISLFPQDANQMEALLRLSDIAMFRARQKSENESSFAYYSEEMNLHTLHQLRIEIDLLHAIEHDELLLHYQPKVNMQDGAITGAEALVRWQHPERGLLMPAEFIQVAESSGLIAPLSEWVLEAACKQAAYWKALGLAPIRIAVNITAVEFTRTLPTRVSNMLARYQLCGNWLELEITEGMLMQGTEHVIAIMEDICRQDVSVALDDFGTGYSSLSYLKRFPIHSLKIDRSFTQGIPTDQNDCTIASAIIGIAKQLKLKVIAEGVETLEQLMYLKDAGCDELQGYLFSKPVAAEVFKQMLEERLSLQAVMH